MTIMSIMGSIFDEPIVCVQSGKWNHGIQAINEQIIVGILPMPLIFRRISELKIQKMWLHSWLLQSLTH